MAVNNANTDISALREEVNRLSKIISAQSSRAYSDTRERANDVYEAAAPQARKAVAQVKAEGQAIAEVAREHPAGIGSVLVLATGLGILVGYVLGAASQPEPTSRNWWR